MTAKKGEVATKENVMNFNSLTQDDIPAFLERVNEKISALTGGKPKDLTIDVDLPGFGRVPNIKTVKNLIEAYSMVTNKEKAYNEAAKKALPAGVSKPPFTINNVGVKRWCDLIEDTISTVAHKVELEKLKKVKAKLEENLSKKAKLANDLKDIAGILDLG